jgi:hypothetical protein
MPGWQLVLPRERYRNARCVLALRRFATRFDELYGYQSQPIYRHWCIGVRCPRRNGSWSERCAGERCELSVSHNMWRKWFLTFTTSRQGSLCMTGAHGLARSRARFLPRSRIGFDAG